MSDGSNIVEFPTKEIKKSVPKGNAPGIISLLFGILSVIMFLMFINFFTAIIAIVLGIVQIARGGKKTAAVTGIATAVISIVMSFVGWGIIFSNEHLAEVTMEYFKSDDMDDYMRDVYEMYGIDPDSVL